MNIGEFTTPQAMGLLELGFKIRCTEWCEGQYIFFTKENTMRDEHLQLVNEIWFSKDMKWEIVENDEHKPYMINQKLNTRDMIENSFTIICNKCGKMNLFKKGISIGSWYGGEVIIECECGNEQELY